MTRQEIEAILAELAGRQHGVVARAQLLDSGMSPDVVAGLVRSGRLRRVHRGVYAVGPMVPDLATEMAASLACGPGATVSHLSAISIWAPVGGSRAKGPVDITLTTGIRRRPGIRVHRVRTLRAEETTTFEAIPVTTPARTLLDSATVLGRRDLERALAEALARYRVDFLWRREKLVVEIDGFAFHSSRKSFEDDRRRDAALMAAGMRVLRFTWRQVTQDPETTVVRLVQALGTPDRRSS